MKPPIFPTHGRSTLGFTLTELLVVIVIIAIVAALSMTLFVRARNSADRVGAARNLSQIQVANVSYATDHAGRFLPLHVFDEEGGTYVGCYGNPDFISQFIGDAAERNFDEVDRKLGPKLPLTLLDPAVVRAKKEHYDRFTASFGYNETGMPGGSWATRSASRSYQLAQLTAPERSAAFFTATDFIAKYGGRFLWNGNKAVEGYTKDGKIAFRHGKKAMVVYYDGHVGEITKEQLKQIDQQGGASNIFWRADAKQ